ncbi:MAG: hypothetical protein AAF657_10400, partial [Acidobacteriota bacterium]
MRLANVSLGLLLVMVAPSARADWLVLQDGTRVETEGPWKTKGRQVIFTRAGGALSALRLADVDLEASAAATAEASERATEEVAAAAKPSQRDRPRVLVLTDEDLPPVIPEPDELDDADAAEGEDSDEEEESAETEAEEAAPEPVSLVSWESRESTDIDGLEIIGAVRNTGRDVAAGIRVSVKIRDQEDVLLSESKAFLQASSLAPGQRSTFKALLPGVYTLLVDPTFEVSSE